MCIRDSLSTPDYEFDDFDSQGQHDLHELVTYPCLPLKSPSSELDLNQPLKRQGLNDRYHAVREPFRQSLQQVQLGL